jgi:hypothetical protein
MKLAKKYTYLEWRKHELEEANWEEGDQKRLNEFLLTTTGKKLMQSLINAEVFKIQEIFNLSDANREYQIGMVQGAAITRSKVVALAMEPKKSEAEEELSIAELDDVIKERLLGYNNRRFNE